jgi:hypothetical protein
MPRLVPRHQILAFAALFISVFLAFSFYFLSQPFLADGDSYYHLGIAKQFNERGIIDELPWARFSVMREGFGDKELLFHLVLAGFTAPPIDAEEMGRLAVAFFNAVLFTLLGWLATRALGWWGMLVPAYIYLGSYPFADRVFRLRPELMALTLLLLLIWLAARRRYGFLALVAALFALAYTAWHVVALLALLFTIADRFRTARIEWKTPAAILGGLAGGLLVHPHFPHNLIVWWYQNVLFFFYKSMLDVGTEIHPPTVRDSLLYHLPVVLSLVIYWFCTRAASDVDEENGRAARYFLVAATLFALLFLGMARMVTWLIPLAVLAVIFHRRIVVRRAALAIGLAVTLAAAAFQTVLIFGQQAGEMHVAEALTAELGQSIPNGAKVATNWRYGTVLVFYAPQGRYFNVLDPVFMAASHPREHAISERLWSGDAVDVAAALRIMDSDLILFDRTQARRLYTQITRDPRFVPLFGRAGAGDILAQLSLEGSAKFLRDWRVTPNAPAVPITQWPLHSWSPDRRVREMEAYVDLAPRSAGPNCRTAAHELPIRTGTIEIAPSGPTQVHIDGVLVAKTDRDSGAVLGTGLLIPLRLTEGTHWLVVTTCRSGNQRGFYALMR